MKNAYTVVDIRLVSTENNGSYQCEHCGIITPLKDMFIVTVESDDTRSGLDELTLCEKCTAEMEEQ